VGGGFAIAFPAITAMNALATIKLNKEFSLFISLL
jgi:hypothetical protein